MPDHVSKLPEWVRLRDGSQVPFEADRVCQSLFAASESLGAPNAFLARELTDAVLHFLGQEDHGPILTTLHVMEQVGKIVRELGHPALARRYLELREASASHPVSSHAEASVALHAGDTPEDLVQRCLETYSLSRVYSPDLRAAACEGLIHLSGLASPTTLTRFLVDAPTLGGDSWWLHGNDWNACGDAWIIDSPEWLSILAVNRSPIIRLCERIIALPRITRHPVELHLNVAEPPSWIVTQTPGPLFATVDDPANHLQRFGMLDLLLEQCLEAPAEHAPAVAWHLNDAVWSDEKQLARLRMLARHAVLGKPVRFVFDRPGAGITLAEGMDRKVPGVMLEVGLDLPRLARRPEIANDGATLLKKLPSLARMAGSAAAQKRVWLRRLPEASPLRRSFLIERASCVVAPVGLDAVVRSVTGLGIVQSPLSLDFALQILHTLKAALASAGRLNNLDLRLDQLPNEPLGWDAAETPHKQIEMSGRLHARANGGTTLLLAPDADASSIDALVDLLRWTWETTSVQRLQLRRAGGTLRQGELAI